MLAMLQKPGLRTRSGTLYLSNAMEDERGRCTDFACRDRRYPMTSCARFLAASGMEREKIRLMTVSSP